MNIGILESDGFSKIAMKVLDNVGSVKIFNNDKTSLKEFISDKEILFTRLGIKFTKELLSEARVLKFLCSPTTGLNHIDLDYCQTNDINIISLKGEIDFLQDIRATPEHTLGLILALLRKYKSAFIKAGDSGNRDDYRGEELFKNQIGFIGFGRVAKLVHQYVSALGAEASYFDPYVKNQDLTKFDTLAELVSHNQIIVCCAEYNEETRLLINEDVLSLMQDKYFINTARGEIVDQVVLLDLIKNNFFKGVALDVLTNESIAEFENIASEINNKMNFILTPHIGGATIHSMQRTEEFVCQKLKQKLL